METTLDILKRIESNIHKEMNTFDQQIKEPKTEYERAASLWRNVGLHVALISIHEEMDKITGLGRRGS